MHIAIIGNGAIGQYVQQHARAAGHRIEALIVKPSRLNEADDRTLRIAEVVNLPTATQCVLDCAGHTALRQYGPELLRAGVDVITVSLGALADESLHEDLASAARDGGARLHLASGAIGALDALRAARVGGLDSVTYIGRKPPQGWAGSPAQDTLNLDALQGEAQTHFEGSARAASINYPKNANVAAAVALAGIGFDATRVALIADPNVHENIHEIVARGRFGEFKFEIRGRSLPDNPRSSALAAMSVLAKLAQQHEPIVIG
ncbi:MAG: aspartate dehydrogenase [Gammaproteobacteria bacterium]